MGILTGIILAAAIAGLIILNLPAFGRLPRGSRLERILQSPNYRDGQFRNLEASPMMTGDKSRLSGILEFLFRKKEGLRPDAAVPALKTDLRALDRDSNLLVWFGHSPSLGCYERTLAYLIEEYAGALPTWMAPEQVRFLPVTDRAADYCAEQAKKLEDMGFRVEVDYRNEKIGRKIRDAQTEKVPYMVIVGDRDMENGTVSPRHRADGDLGAMSVDEFSALLKRVVDNKEQK